MKITEMKLPAFYTPPICKAIEDCIKSDYSDLDIIEELDIPYARGSFSTNLNMMRKAGLINPTVKRKAGPKPRGSDGKVISKPTHVV